MGSQFVSTVVMFLAVTPSLAAPAASEHPPELYEHSQHFCYSCPPGYSVKKHCETGFTHSECEPCGPGQYMDKPNKKTQCLLCLSDCSKLSVQVQNCTSTTNKECQCGPGTYNTQNDGIDTFLHCLKHTPCNESSGVTFPGDHERNRECRLCRTAPGPNQEFVDASDPDNPRCQLCSSCPGSCITQEAPPRVVCNRTAIAYTVKPPPASSTTAPDKTTKRTHKKGTESTHGLDGGLVSLIAALIMVMVFVILTFVYRKWRDKQKKKTLNRCPDGNGVTVEMKPLHKPEINGAVHTNGSSPSAGDHPSAPVAVQDSHGALADSGVEWDVDDIKKKAFLFLSRNVGHDWRFLIRHLPGITPGDAEVLLEHAEMDNMHSKDRIFGALTEWTRRCENQRENVTKAALLKALAKAGLKNVIPGLVAEMEPQANTNGSAHR